MGATYKLKHKKADGTIEEVAVPISTVDGLQTALDGKQPSGSYVTTNTAQTISGAKTLTNTLKIQSGNPAGAFVLGGNVSSTGLTANTRKLGRMGVPAYTSNGSTVTSTVAGISFDAQANANYADFGGHPRNTSSIAPDVIRFVVADSHDNNVAGNRTLAFQIAKQIVADSVDGATSFAGAKFFVPVEATGTIKATGGFVGDLTGTADDADKLGGQLPAYYLDYNNLTNKPTMPSGSAEPFIVTFTNNGNDNYTADATYEDIEQAFANGKVVIGKDSTNSYIYQIFGLSDDDTIPFSRIVNWGEDGAVVETLFVNTDDSVSYVRSTLGDGSSFIVTITLNGDAYEADYTFDEIYNKIQEGQTVVARYGNGVYQLTVAQYLNIGNTENGSIVFSHFSLDEAGSQGELPCVWVERFEFSHSGAIYHSTRTVNIPLDYSSIYLTTVNSVDYDGDMLMWYSIAEFDDENGSIVKETPLTLNIPLLAGDGISFTPNSDNTRIFISATNTGGGGSSGGVAQLQQSVTHAELKALRDNGELVAGMQYRITDFVTTTSQPDTQSAGHPFDIIVTALSNNTLSENASADYHKTIGGATFDPSVLADEDGNLNDGAVVSHYYVFEDFVQYDTGTMEGYKDTDGFIAYDYLENGDGVVVPVIYKTDSQGAIDSPEEFGEPDYEDIFYYDGTMEVDGVTYDKWRKICETQENGPFWDGRTGYIWALTNVIVNSGSAVDPYFADANLSAWEIKYCLDNDKTRFAWADEENGKGVIYYMKDEWGNECHYDFKNIMFKRSTDWFAEHSDWAESVWGYTPTENKWFYTFTWVDENDEVQDLTLIGNSLLNDEGKINGVFGNKIGISSEYQIYLGENSVEALSYNVFVSSYSYDGGIFYGCYSNTFSSNCDHNTFGNECYSNTFGNGCFSNTFSNLCFSNTFGNECYSNTFGKDCDCNTFGNGCSKNTLSEYAFCNIFENGVVFVDLTSTTQGNSNNRLQNITVSQGIKGTSSSNRKTINATRNLAYKTTYVAQGSVTTEV